MAPDADPLSGKALFDQIEQGVNPEEFQQQNWFGSFEEYLAMVQADPKICRTAFQRIYDLIMSYGYEERTHQKNRLLHYHFFDDPVDDGRDAIFGLDKPLARLVSCFKSAAHQYGTEKRVLLLHGPVGSSKSTIARLLKKGLERYCKTDQGMLYTFQWQVPGLLGDDWHDCPMHEEPLRLIPQEQRNTLLDSLTKDFPSEYKIGVKGGLCPLCRYVYKELMREYKGDWRKVLGHVRVRRLILSEADRVGIGTFQPKDEKNQDSTELTGDINYRKIAEYGTDSDPRAFNFDGEFNVANRGIVEFIEVLKLDVAFLYDLLGASQEHSIKPKKFAQTEIDEVILGHSVSGHTPIPFRHAGVTGWSTLEGLHTRFADDPTGLEVLAYDFDEGATRWTRAKAVLRHTFDGELLTTVQSQGVVETTPNHSIYGEDGKTFFPPERKPLLAVRELGEGFGRTDPIVDLEALVEEPATVGAASAGETDTDTRWNRALAGRDRSRLRLQYHAEEDADALEDLVAVLTWYALRGNPSGVRKGVEILHTERSMLERVRDAFRRLSTARAEIDPKADGEGRWRLFLESGRLERVATTLCGAATLERRLPDFVFRLPRAAQRRAYDALRRAAIGARADRGASANSGDAAEAKARELDLRTGSSMLAAQVGMLMTQLGLDYRVHAQQRDGRPWYRVRTRPWVRGEAPEGEAPAEPSVLRRPGNGAWVYDIECEGLHNFVCGVGAVVCHNTNEPEYRKLQNNELMEAFRDRTIKIDVPYNTVLTDEIRIYEKDYNAERITGKHIAPHTIEVAAMWAVLSRLEDPKNAQITLLQKLKLYNGKTLTGFTEDNIRELKEATRNEGMDGISPRYVQDKISNALVSDHSVKCINPFMVMNELEEGLRHHSLITNDEQRKRFTDLLGVVKQEYEDIVKNEVQRAISADKEAIQRLCANYVDNIKAYTQKEKVRNAYTGQDEEPDERLMRSIEEKIDIPENRKEDFRREIMNYIGALAIEGRTFDYSTNERLQKALELKLFEDQKDSIKLTSLVSSVVDRETQEKIDVVRSRLTKNYGYCDVCAGDVLSFVAGIFARGDIKE